MRFRRSTNLPPVKPVTRRRLRRRSLEQYERKKKMLSGLMSKLASGGGQLPTIEHGDFARLVKEGSCAVVDVREPQEYAAGHVPGARNLPLSQFDPSKLPSGACVIICQAGGRSSKALALAIQAGRKDVRHYAPGTGGWRARGGGITL
jgi:rhodanese-related sulfurtransferase